MFFNYKIEQYMESPLNSEGRKAAVSQMLQDLRKRAGLTQREVCHFIQVSPQTYSGYEKGKYEPTMETIVRLSLLYGVSTDHILCNWVDEQDEAISYFENVDQNKQLEDLRMEFDIMRQEIEELKKIHNSK